MLLKSIGFDAMARDVLSETEDKRIALYVAIILKQSPDHLKDRVWDALAKAGIIRPGGFWVKGN